MDSLMEARTAQIVRLHNLTQEVGQLPHVSFCQVWTRYLYPGVAQIDPATGSPIVLWVQAQSAVRDYSLLQFAHYSKVSGISQKALELIGDTLNKGCTKLVEDLEHAAPYVHPRNKLQGVESFSACQYIPIFDPLDPLRGLGKHSKEHVVCGVLEVIISKHHEALFNHSDVILHIEQLLHRHSFSMSTNASSFHAWRTTPSTRSSPVGPVTPKASPRNSMSRTTSTRFLDSSSDEMLVDATPVRVSHRRS